MCIALLRYLPNKKEITSLSYQSLKELLNNQQHTLITTFTKFSRNKQIAKLSNHKFTPSKTQQTTPQMSQKEVHFRKATKSKRGISHLFLFQNSSFFPIIVLLLQFIF